MQGSTEHARDAGRHSWAGPVWFWALVALGAALRIALAVGTLGSEDIRLWSEHASGSARDGVIWHYAVDPLFNHPPLAGWSMARLWELAQSTGVPFRALFRIVVSLADLSCVPLIVRAMGASRWRWAAGALYAIAPVPVILSGHHGNTDALIAPILLGSALCAANGRPLWAGLLLGFGTWIKIPAVIAAPAIGFVFPRWRQRFECAGAALLVAALPLAVAAALSAQLASMHPELPRAHVNFALERVLLYRGLEIGVPGRPDAWIWGLRNVYARGFGPPPQWPSFARWSIENGTSLALAAILAFAFLRRRERTVLGLCTSIAGSFALFYVLAENWATQYLAWSAPFWILAGPRFAICAHSTAGAYVYALYAFICSDPLLRGPWDWLHRTQWPAWLELLRDVACLTFLAFAALWFVSAVAGERAAWRRAAPEALGESPRIG